MTKQPNYKTRPGGSIDYRHYLDRSAKLRSQEFRAATGALWRAFMRLFIRRSANEPAFTRTAQVRLSRVSRPMTRKLMPSAKAVHRVDRIAQN